jgi:hypothetical protein
MFPVLENPIVKQTTNIQLSITLIIIIITFIFPLLGKQYNKEKSINE